VGRDEAAAVPMRSPRMRLRLVRAVTAPAQWRRVGGVRGLTTPTFA